ncbi:MAG: hypothetical protein K9N06_08285 [Candidatus Cloacimonetes bacterium]|nr:hypothetical protein [Candidatus Cloacimonadota bacterium]
MKHYEEYQNINQRKGLPRSYWFNQFIRWFTILFASFAIAYAFWLIFKRIDADSSTFNKVVPFLIIFFAINSLLRNLFSLNRLLFTEQSLTLTYLLRKNVNIPWLKISSIKMTPARQKLLKITWLDDENREMNHEMTLAFPRMLEIINAIVEMCPQVELDEFLDSVVISDREKTDLS